MLLRELIGAELRRERLAKGLTLRDVAAHGAVSLGYLSEVERGAKEPSSEVLAAVCRALTLPMSSLLVRVAAEAQHMEPTPLRVLGSESVAA